MHYIMHYNYALLCCITNCTVKLDGLVLLLQFGDQTFGQVVGGARNYYSFELYLETRKEHETFQKYNKGGKSV